MRPNMANVIDGFVINDDGTRSDIFIDTPAWFEWLRQQSVLYYKDKIGDVQISLVVRYNFMHKRGWWAFGEGCFPYELGATEQDVNSSNLYSAAQIAGCVDD